jgi:hypothetical protein
VARSGVPETTMAQIANTVIAALEWVYIWLVAPAQENAGKD